MGSGPQRSDLADTPSWNPQAPVAGQAPQMGNTQPIQYSGAFGQPSNNFAGGGMGKGPQQMGQQPQGQYDAWGRPGGAPAASTPPQATAPMAPQAAMEQPGMMGHQGKGGFNNQNPAYRDTPFGQQSQEGKLGQINNAFGNGQDPRAGNAMLWDMGGGAFMRNPSFNR